MSWNCKGTPEAESLEETSENSHRGCWRDMLGQTVPSIRTAATGKTRSSTVDSRVWRTFSDSEEADRRRLQALKSAVYSSSSARYDGGVPCCCS